MMFIHDPITFILICLVCHFIADFNKQFSVHLGDFKQKIGWKNLFENYIYDYIASLLIHAFVWSIITFLPYLISEHYDCWKMLFTVIANTVIHVWVDHHKCNNSLNLVQDQTIHFLQVVGFSLVLWYV